MLVYRVASRKYTTDNSEGARLYGGRWNGKGTAVIYSSATVSLAALEVIAHNGAIPADYRVIVIELPDDLRIETLSPDDLPKKWPDDSSIEDTAVLGTNWAASQKSAVLCVPSAVIRDEHNYILNPQHPDFGKIAFDVPDIEYIDPRLRVK